MTLIDLGGGGAEPVALADAKSWCRIERDDEDELIARLVTAARETAERETGTALVHRSFRRCADVVGDHLVASLRGPVTAVTKVAAFDGAGEERVFEPGDVALVRIGAREWFLPSPRVRQAARNGLEIEFEAGFAVGETPEALRQAILRIVAASYETRGVVPGAMQPAIVPPFAKALIAPFREVRL